MKTAIVTGANGFVGSAVVKELLLRNYFVCALDMEGCNSNLPQSDHLVFFPCDIADIMEQVEKLPIKECDVFYHFAWRGSAGNLRGDDVVQLANVASACATVRAAHKLHCKKYIFASSIMEYEIAALMQTDEAPAMSSMYCTAKITANYMCRAIANSLGLEYNAAVISNIYGPGERSPRLVNTSLRKMINGEPTAFSAGEQMYDFIYIDDAARKFAALGEKSIANRTYYIGSNNPRPLKEFLTIMGEVAAPHQDIGLGKLPFNGVSLSYQEFDVNAVYEDTGVECWVPFEEGIRRTLQWLKEQEGQV